MTNTPERKGKVFLWQEWIKEAEETKRWVNIICEQNMSIFDDGDGRGRVALYIGIGLMILLICIFKLIL